MAEDYEQVFDEFWREIVCNEDGTLNVDQVKRELHDFHTLIENVPKVYDHVSGGRISKPNTLAFEVISCFEEHVDRCVEERLADEADATT